MIRKVALLSTLSILMLAPFASQAKKEVSDFDVHKCVVAENCSVLEGLCPGHYVAVNLRYENLTRENLSKSRKSTSCDAKIRDKKPGAVCVKNQCQLREGK